MLESLIVSAGTPSGGTAGSIAAAGVVRIGLRSSTGGGARAATGNPRSDFRIRTAGPLTTISLISIFFAAAMRAAKGLILILPASLACGRSRSTGTGATSRSPHGADIDDNWAAAPPVVSGDRGAASSTDDDRKR